MDSTIIARPKAEIHPDILKELRSQTESEGQVILHFLFRNSSFTLGDVHIRIWPSTYLYDTDSDHKSEMVHVENIALYPEWHIVKPGGKQHFTLIFSGLPKACTHFHFIEHCTNEAGAFKVKDIKRNTTDVYYFQM